MTKLFLETEFQHEGNKQTKKREFSAKSCGFPGRNRFRKFNDVNTTQKRTKIILDKLSSLGQEPTFHEKKNNMNKLNRVSQALNTHVPVITQINKYYRKAQCKILLFRMLIRVPSST